MANAPVPDPTALRLTEHDRPLGQRTRSGRNGPPRLSGRSGYSRFVTLAKVLLPALAVALLLLVVVWPQFFKDTQDLIAIDSETAREQAQSLSMVDARFEGVDDQNQPFNVAAARATHDREDENRVTLEAPKADMTMSDGTWLALGANAGVYQRIVKTLELVGAVNLFHDGGFEIATEFALIDFESGTARGFEPVHGEGEAGIIDSGGFEVLDRGDVIVFTGPATLVLHSDPSQGGDATTMMPPQ